MTATGHSRQGSWSLSKANVKRTMYLRKQDRSRCLELLEGLTKVLVRRPVEVTCGSVGHEEKAGRKQPPQRGDKQHFVFKNDLSRADGQ